MDKEDIKKEMRDRFFMVIKNGDQERRKPHYQQIYMNRGRDAEKVKDEFFDEAYAEIMLDLFLRWTQTHLNEVEFRESLFQNVLALGAIKNKLVEYQRYARNAPFLMENEQDEDEGNESI